MISTDRDSGGFVTVVLDGRRLLVHEGQHRIDELKKQLGTGGVLIQQVGTIARPLRDDDSILVIGGERFTVQ